MREMGATWWTTLGVVRAETRLKIPDPMATTTPNSASHLSHLERTSLTPRGLARRLAAISAGRALSASLRRATSAGRESLADDGDGILAGLVGCGHRRPQPLEELIVSRTGH